MGLYSDCYFFVIVAIHNFITADVHLQQLYLLILQKMMG